MYGEIAVLDYSKNNNLVKFKCRLLKPIRTVIAWGIHNFNTGKTFIKIIKYGLERNNINISKDEYMQVINKILSSNDWDENVAYYAYKPSEKYNTVSRKRFMQMWETLKN